MVVLSSSFQKESIFSAWLLAWVELDAVRLLGITQNGSYFHLGGEPNVLAMDSERSGLFAGRKKTVAGTSKVAPPTAGVALGLIVCGIYFMVSPDYQVGGPAFSAYG